MSIQYIKFLKATEYRGIWKIGMKSQNVQKFCITKTPPNLTAILTFANHMVSKSAKKTKLKTKERAPI